MDHTEDALVRESISASDSKWKETGNEISLETKCHFLPWISNSSTSSAEPESENCAESRELNWELLEVTRKPVTLKKEGGRGNKQDRKTSTSPSGVTMKGTWNDFGREVNRTLCGSDAGEGNQSFSLGDPHLTHEI